MDRIESLTSFILCVIFIKQYMWKEEVPASHLMAKVMGTCYKRCFI